MSKLARALMVGATLAAMNLAAMATVAQATEHTIEPYARPPLERQLGGVLPPPPRRTREQSDDHRPGRPAGGDKQRYWYYQSTLAARQAQARLQPPLESRVGEQHRTPSNAPMQPAEPSPEPNPPIALVGLLAAALALIGALVTMTISRAARKARVRQAV